MLNVKTEGLGSVLASSWAPLQLPTIVVQYPLPAITLDLAIKVQHAENGTVHALQEIRKLKQTGQELDKHLRHQLFQQVTPSQNQVHQQVIYSHHQLVM